MDYSAFGARVSSGLASPNNLQKLSISDNSQTRRVSEPACSFGGRSVQKPFSIRLNTSRCRSNRRSKGDLAASIRRALNVLLLSTLFGKIFPYTRHEEEVIAARLEHAHTTSYCGTQTEWISGVVNYFSRIHRPTISPPTDTILASLVFRNSLSFMVWCW